MVGMVAVEIATSTTVAMNNVAQVCCALWYFLPDNCALHRINFMIMNIIMKFYIDYDP